MAYQRGMTHPQYPMIQHNTTHLLEDHKLYQEHIMPLELATKSQYEVAKDA